MKELLEELFGKVDTYGIKCNVYKNPTRKELTLAYVDKNGNPSNLVRFSAFADTKDIYVYSFDLTHSQFYLNFDIPFTKRPSLDCTAKQGKIIDYCAIKRLANDSEKGDRSEKFVKKVISSDWSFLKKYFLGVDDAIEDLRGRLKK
jgi:hypothetical protein